MKYKQEKELNLKVKVMTNHDMDKETFDKMIAEELLQAEKLLQAEMMLNSRGKLRYHFNLE